MKVPCSSSCRHGALMKSCHGVACVAGGVRERVVFGGGSAVLFSCAPSPQQGACMYDLFPPRHEGSCEQQKFNSTPHQFLRGFATLIHSRLCHQNKILPATQPSHRELYYSPGSRFSFKCRLDECLEVASHNPC